MEGTHHTKKKFRLAMPTHARQISEEEEHCLRADESPSSEVTTDPFTANDKYPSVTTMCDEQDSCADFTAVDRNGITPLHIACRDGFYEIARYSTHELDIANYDGLTCLHLAVMNRHVDILQLLIERDVHLNTIERKAGRTILHMARISLGVKLVQTLMSVKSCTIDARTYSGYTPLDLARDYHKGGVNTILAAAGAKHGTESVDSDSD
ncbi:hypothetical protein DPMN_112229 [Dreissena polymorpha]|uniref:Uncharacterized protein n=1 Tax=Dreissena polymorpha TaxID=45954 RepID=A0A9D4QPQ7_DREPO|nr:hypothetical protein DPMN_112229 [Dreissena polymorpha]